jgi:hypothetical protein
MPSSQTPPDPKPPDSKDHQPAKYKPWETKPHDQLTPEDLDLALADLFEEMERKHGPLPSSDLPKNRNPSTLLS